jgi:hypothetical protein
MVSMDTLVSIGAPIAPASDSLARVQIDTNVRLTVVPGVTHRRITASVTKRPEWIASSAASSSLPSDDTTPWRRWNHFNRPLEGAMNAELIRRSVVGFAAGLALTALSACATPVTAPYSSGDAKCHTADWNQCVYLF